MTTLIGEVLDDAREIANAEIDKLKAEAKQVGETAKITGIAFGILIVAAMLIGTALSLGLVAAGLPAWASFGIVGVVAVLAGVLVARKARTPTLSERSPSNG